MKIAFLDRSVSSVRTLADLGEAKCGRITCLTAVSDYLACQGASVDVIGLWEEFDTPAGARWRTRATGKYDFLVFLRGIGSGAPEISAKRRILWVRDLPHSGFIAEPRMARGLHSVVYLSRYAQEVWQDYYRDLRYAPAKIIPNGVDSEVFCPDVLVPSNPHRLLFASNPNRGLKRLPLIAQALREYVPDVEVVALSSQERLHPGEAGDHTEAYVACRDAGIDLRDPVPQSELAEWIQSSAAVLMPTEYPEICSNLVLQSLACGTPLVTTGGIGATPEWAKHRRNALLTRWNPQDYVIFDLEFTRLCKTLLESHRLQTWLRWGARHTRVLDWEEVGSKWAKLLSS